MGKTGLGDVKTAMEIDFQYGPETVVGKAGDRRGEVPRGAIYQDVYPTEFLDGRRQPRRLDNLVDAFTLNGAFEDEEAVLDELLRDSVEAGTLPPDGTLDGLREKGSVRFSGLGMFAPGLSVAADVREDKTLGAFEWHVEKGTPFPTLTRRAQFLIDHPWFAEAGEDLPCHKDPPRMGGDYPLTLTR